MAANREERKSSSRREMTQGETQSTGFGALQSRLAVHTANSYGPLRSRCSRHVETDEIRVSFGGTMGIIPCVRVCRDRRGIVRCPLDDWRSVN